jgi:uncharacterized protein (TIGR00297 family)
VVKTISFFWQRTGQDGGRQRRAGRLRARPARRRPGASNSKLQHSARASIMGKMGNTDAPPAPRCRPAYNQGSKRERTPLQARYTVRVDLAVRVTFGALFSSLIAVVALQRGSLSRSGAAAALAVGTVIYLGGGGAWFAALLTFFATSTLLGRLGRARKFAIKHDFEKGDTRDAWQALANGGVATLCALGMLLLPDARWSAAFIASLAAANGDTWATEIGTLSRRDPFSLTRLRRVPRGSSGAVSLLGLLATALGGAAVGLVAALNPDAFGLSPAELLTCGLLGGVLGSLLDSLLGATLQAEYHCPRCETNTEGRRHRCGTATRLVRGFHWFGNDFVNLSATLFGAGLGWLTALFGA